MKMTEVGLVPKEWDVLSLSEVGRFSKGSGITREQSNSGILPCVRYGEIYTTHDNYIREFSSFISPEVALTSTRLSKGDILSLVQVKLKKILEKPLLSSGMKRLMPAEILLSFHPKLILLQCIWDSF